MRVELLVKNIGQLVTFEGTTALSGKAANEPQILENAWLAVAAGKIVAKGQAELPSDLDSATQVVDAGGRCVIPGLVDPHTHAVFAGNRAEEFARRLAGATYLEILASGGGILNTVSKTRAASAEDLLAQAQETLQLMLAHGTTTLEIKSGYGLDMPTELKQLEVIRSLSGQPHLPRIVATFLGAHALPPEYKDNREEFINLLCQEMIPQVAERGLAEFCDVFCEEGVFSVDESRRILEAGQRYGLKPKVHADEIVPLGGSGLAADLGAVSADHLCYASSENLAKMAEKQVVAVLLPGTSFMLRHQEDAPARKMLELGLPVALATDYNPGTCPVKSMQVMIGLACLRMRLTPAEALCAATLNAACAIERGAITGSLEPTKAADFLILDATSYVEIPYRFGENLVQTVYKDGQLVYQKPN